MDLLQIQTKIDSIGKLNSKKRPEENNKFVFKGVMKLLKGNYYKTHNLKNKKSSEEKFFEHYFLEEARRNDLDIILYYDPLNISEIKQTLNIEYLKRIFREDQFRKDFFEAIDRDFLLYYKKSLKKKISTMFEKYYQKIKTKGDETATNSFIQHMRNSKRFKFPWCLNEVNDALSYFKQHILVLIAD